MIAVVYRVVATATAKTTLLEITDSRVVSKLLERMSVLATTPEMQGKPMHDDLRGFRSLRAVGQRYRILYRVDPRSATVFVHVVGIRKEGDRHDVYAIARKLFRLGLL